MPEDLSSNEVITLTSTPLSVEEQIKRNEERRQAWYADKAELLLASDNKKELVVGLISDFNNILGCTKEIETIARDALADKTNPNLKMKLGLRQILKMFPDKEEKVEDKE
jgi:nitric oxide reductase large subunit